MNDYDFLKLIKKQKKHSSYIRLYFIINNKHYFLNQGILKNGFEAKLTVSKNQDT